MHHLTRAWKGCTSQTSLRKVKIISCPKVDRERITSTSKEITFLDGGYMCNMNFQPVIELSTVVCCLSRIVQKWYYNITYQCELMVSVKE